MTHKLESRLLGHEHFPGGPESCFSYSMSTFLVDLNFALVTPEHFPGGPESCFSYSMSAFLVDLNLALITP